VKNFMRWITVSVLFALLASSAVQAQTPAATAPKTPPAQTTTPKAPPTPPAPAAAASPKAAAAPPAPAAAAPAAPAKPAVDVTKLGTDFVDKLNTLDDWRLSMDGKEVGLDKIVDAFMADFAPDVFAELPSDDEEQIGPLELHGIPQVRKWVEKQARSRVELEYLLARQTEKTVEGEFMVYSKPLPWGGVGIAFPILAPYSTRVNRDRFLEVETVFLQFGPDQKIHRFQMYVSEKSPLKGAREP
jgi:hypothetical protein